MLVCAIESWVLGILSKTSPSFTEHTHKGEGHSDSDFSTAGKKEKKGTNELIYKTEIKLEI